MRKGREVGRFVNFGLERFEIEVGSPTSSIDWRSWSVKGEFIFLSEGINAAQILILLITLKLHYYINHTHISTSSSLVSCTSQVKLSQCLCCRWSSWLQYYSSSVSKDVSTCVKLSTTGVLPHGHAFTPFIWISQSVSPRVDHCINIIAGIFGHWTQDDIDFVHCQSLPLPNAL